MERLSGTQKLIKALHEEKLDTKAYRNLLALVEADYYDDYKSDLVFPRRQLAHDLQTIGLSKLAMRVMLGEFDAEAWEGDEWWESEGKEAFFNDPILQDMATRLGVPIKELLDGSIQM
jgi:hypothetical protein